MPGDVSNAVIASLARRPDVTTGTNGFAGFARGLSSGMNVGQGWKSAREEMANRDDFEDVMGSRPPGPEPTRQQMGQGVAGKLGGFARAFLGGAGEEARGADPMFGLRQKLMEQNVQMSDLKINEFLTQRDEQIKNNAAYREFSDMMNGFISSGQAADPKSLGAMQTYLGRNPTLLKDPRTKDLITMYQAASKLQEAATQRQENKEFIAGALQNSPEGTFPQSANIESGSFSRGVLPKAANVPANLQEASAITNLRRRIAQTTDPAMKADLEMELNDVLNTTGGKSNIIRTNPDGTTEVIMGANVGDLTASQRGQNVQQSSKLVDSARRIADIIPKVNEIFGPANAAKTVVVDRTLSNINPNWADGERIQGRAAAGFAMENILRSMNEGMGAMSNADVVRLKAKFPELNNVSELMESPVRAEEILLAVTKELTRDAYVKSRLTGNALDQDSLRLLDPMFLAQELTAGRISKEAYREAIKSSIHTKEITRLLNQKNKQKAP